MNECDVNINLCNDDNIKVIEVEYDTGSLKRKYVFQLCKNCNELEAYQKFRLSERKLN